MGSQTVALSVVGFVRVDEVIRRMRADMVRSNLYWLLGVIADEFGGDAGFAAAGAKDRGSQQLRQVAIFLGNTVMGFEERQCAEAFQLHRSQATRAVQAIEERREAEPLFDERLERVEARIRDRMGVR